MGLVHLFDDFDSDVICVVDCELSYDGRRITHISLDENGDVRYWAGDPERQDAVEVEVDPETRHVFSEQIQYALG